jgi:hypothetical protein
MKLAEIANTIVVWVRERIMMTIVEYSSFLSIVEMFKSFRLFIWLRVIITISSFLHRFKSFVLRNFSHDQREFRRTRDEMSSISRSETHDLLQISIYFEQESRLLSERNSHVCHLQFLIIARAHSTHRRENSSTRKLATFFVFTSYVNIVIEVVS